MATEQIDSRLDELETVLSSATGGVDQDFSESINELQNEINILCTTVPRRQTEMLQQRLSRIKTQHANVGRHKKFSFRRKVKQDTLAKFPLANSIVPSGAQANSVERPAVEGGAADVLKLSNMQNKCFVQGQGSLDGKTCILRNLKNCNILLLDHLGAVYCHELTNCFIWLGAVSSSALLYDIIGCDLVVAAKQLRIHDSSKLEVYAHTKSNPVLEASSAVVFHPYHLNYTGLDEQLAVCGLEPLSPKEDSAEAQSENWRKVLDFNWHKQQASPNWKIGSECKPSFSATVEREANGWKMTNSLPPPWNHITRVIN